jgi:hypothetical protein
VPRGYLEDNWGDPSSWLLLAVVQSSKRTETRSTEEYKRSACDSVRLNTSKLLWIDGEYWRVMIVSCVNV